MAKLPHPKQDSIVIERREVLAEIPISKGDAGFGIPPVTAAFEEIGRIMERLTYPCRLEFTYGDTKYSVEANPSIWAETETATT